MPSSIQTFPTGGELLKNLNLPLAQLAALIGEVRQGALSYVVKSVRIDRITYRFEQQGSGPNIQWDRLTLCTCKHQMRARLDSSQWKGKWLAGFTGRRCHEGLHWLFFLTRVIDAHESHADLWDSLPATVRKAKSAQGHYLGDVFAPRGKIVGQDRFNPRRYVAPSRHSHHRGSCDSRWHNDINYRHANRYGRQPSLLVGDPLCTFLWEKPLIFFDEHHCRNFKKWDTVGELLGHLECKAQ
jgi:hypothetical protein